MKLNNKYYILRHGEAVSNTKNICSSWPEKFGNPLTKDGKKQIEKVAEKLKGKHVDLIFASDLLRTKQTAQIVEKVLNSDLKFDLSQKVKLVWDKRLREIDFGVFNGKSITEFQNYFNGPEEKAKKCVPKGESYPDVLLRLESFFEEINEKYKEKTILIISHQAPLLLLLGSIRGYSVEESISPLHNVFNEKRITKGELIKINYGL
jgi:broad specificity phosphatase PhoE